MNITSLTYDFTWDLIPCDELLAGYSGCELPDKAGNASIPFSFLLRSKDQPSTTKGHDCSRMNITSLTDDYTWDLIPCDEHLAVTLVVNYLIKLGMSQCLFPFFSGQKISHLPPRDTTVAE